MLRSNEKGVTLIETLAILVIGSIVMLLVFNILSTGIKNSKQIQERANLQNEANYLLVVLREFHERGIDYTITFTGEKMIIEDINQQHKTLFNNYHYEVNHKAESLTIFPKKEDKSFQIELKLMSKKYPDIEHTTKTVLQIL